ncbi:MAG: 3-phosphoshikimate 1-carboxyvinyltransferase [Muribaculum sp.]|nr:3-phosphoshikimate 1-carboxyvinyltransferase [Muribaculaceae bacterium]MCM1080267.1 3-phosphoshikimate 1-carboxyvinyltransferase [Muribaculum sp.]
MDLQIFPPDDGFPQAVVDLPLSKSISNRALIINALTPDALPLARVADCDDTDAIVKALDNPRSTEINIGAAGTAMRFLTAFYAGQCDNATRVLDGSDRMRQRPIGKLVDALRLCGAEIEYAGQEGFPPLRITGRQLAGGDISIPANTSSQFISALLMIAPTMTNGLSLTLDGEIVSQPYIDMTVAMMKQWGVECSIQERGRKIVVPHCQYQATEFSVEADWSAASYWFEIEALSYGDIALKGLTPKSVQGDSRVADIFRTFGIEAKWDDEALQLQPTPDISAQLVLDMSDVPDLAQTVAVTCCLAGLPFRITGLQTLKIKETDRLEALCTELCKLSYLVEAVDDCELQWRGMRIQRPIDGPLAFDTYSDHRMAMAFAPVSLFVPGIVIRNAEVVTKSYPRWWEHMQQAGFKLIPYPQQ